MYSDRSFSIRSDNFELIDNVVVDGAVRFLRLFVGFAIGKVPINGRGERWSALY